MGTEEPVTPSPRRSRIALSATAGFFTLALILVSSKNNLHAPARWNSLLQPTAIFDLLFLPALVFALVYSFLSSTDMNDVQLKLPAGEEVLGRTAKDFAIRESGFAWFIRRSGIPWGYSVVITNKRLKLYSILGWYHDIWFESITALAWTPSDELRIEFSRHGIKQTFTLFTWGSFSLLLEGMKKAHVNVPEIPKHLGTGMGR